MKKILLRLSIFNMQKVFIFGVVAGAIYYFTLFDDGSSIDANIATIETQMKEEQKKQIESDAALREVEQIRASVASLGDQYKIVSAQIPTDIQPSDILKTIDQMAASAGVSIRGKEPKTTIKKDIVEEMPIQVMAEGTFSELTLFLFNMMNTERISRVLNFSISQQAANSRDRKKSNLVLEAQFANYRFVGEPKIDAAKPEVR